MGGLACAKQIIDQRNALVQQLDCMVATIVLGQETPPTVELLDAFVEAANALASVASKIEFYVREAAEYEDEHGPEGGGKSPG